MHSSVQYALNLCYLATIQILMYSLFIPLQPVYLQLLCMHVLYVVHVAAGACSARELSLSLHWERFIQLCVILSLH